MCHLQFSTFNISSIFANVRFYESGSPSLTLRHTQTLTLTFALSRSLIHTFSYSLRTHSHPQMTCKNVTSTRNKNQITLKAKRQRQSRCQFIIFWRDFCFSCRRSSIFGSSGESSESSTRLQVWL